MRIRISLIAVSLLLTITTVAGCSSGSNGGGSTGSGGIFQRQPVLQTTNLVNGTIAVGPGKSYDVPFTVNGNNATVTGSFSARAGLGDNIEVYVLSNLAYQNWSRGSTYPTGTFYNSGRIATDNLNVSLGPGTYYLVLNNSYSTVSTKQVTANINLNWYQ